MFFLHLKSGSWVSHNRTMDALTSPCPSSDTGKISRREFMRKSAYAAAGALSSGLLGACAATCPKTVVAPNRARRVLADLHVHPMLNDWIKRTPVGIGIAQQAPGLQNLLLRELNPTEITWKTSYQAGVDMICVAHYNPFDELVTMPTDPNPDAVRKTLRMMEILERTLANVPQFATLARNREELQRLTSVDKQNNWADYRIAVAHAIEGGHTLGGSLDSLSEFARRGVAMMTITHFFNKGIASSANAIPYFPDSNSLRVEQGLSEFGREVVRKMEALGIIVDVTHGTATTIEDVLRTATRPVISSHSSARTLGEHPYSLLDEHIQQIAKDGGIVGVILMPYLLSNYSDATLSTEAGSLDDVVRTIRYMFKISGHDHRHIGIGSDFAGFIPPPNDIKCHGNIDLLRQKLLREFDADTGIVEDIMANNVIRFFKKNWTPRPERSAIE